jgi:predicted transposase YdaD
LRFGLGKRNAIDCNTGKNSVQSSDPLEIPLFSKKEIIDLITTIAVYKCIHLSRQEVETMSGVRLEESRVYQDAKAEGKAVGITEGQLQEGRSLIIRQIKRRIGKVFPSLQSKIETLSLTDIEALGEALFDFTAEVDFVTWLQGHS